MAEINKNTERISWRVLGMSGRNEMDKNMDKTWTTEDNLLINLLSHCLLIIIIKIKNYWYTLLINEIKPNRR